MSSRGRASTRRPPGADALAASPESAAAAVAEICAKDSDLARLLLPIAQALVAGTQASRSSAATGIGTASALGEAGYATLTVAQGPCGPGAISESGIAAEKDSSPSPEEEPMYKWVSKKPYRHHKKWRGWFLGLDGKRCHETFDSEEAALAFVAKGKRRLLPGGGHPVGKQREEYLASRKGKIRDTSIETLKFRIGKFMKGREAVPVEMFPWKRAWVEQVATQSVDSQHGTRSAVKAFITFCRKARFIRQDPLADIEIEGKKKRGKKKLHIDEARRFLEHVMQYPEDPLAMACAGLVYTGCRADELMRAQVRDLDADGTLLWVEESKTDEGRRGVEVAEIFQPYLQALAKGRAPEEYLFAFKPERVRRRCKDERKSRRDALLHRTKAVCKAIGVPVVCSQSMRGLHASLARRCGCTGDVVAKALGQKSFSVTKRHYLDKGIEENANLRASLSVICRDAAGNQPSETGYRSTQNDATAPDPEKKNPRVTGG